MDPGRHHTTAYSGASVPAPAPGIPAPGAGLAPPGEPVAVAHARSGADILSTVLLGFAVAMVSAAFALGIVACTGSYWIQKGEGYAIVYHMGIWKICGREGGVDLCTKDGWDNQPSGFHNGIKAVRAFVILGIIFSGIALLKFIAYCAARPTAYTRVVWRLYQSTHYSIGWATLFYLIAFFVFLGIARNSYDVYVAGTGIVRVKAHCDDGCHYARDFWAMMAAMILSQVGAWVLCYSQCFFAYSDYQTDHVV